MRTADFHYDLPDDAIAQSAIEPRDSSRLLDTRDLSDHRFADLPGLLRTGDLVVLNRTRVRRARLHGTKSTGGAVEALLLGPDGDGRWEALVRPARRVRVGTEIAFGATTVTVVQGPDDGRVVLEAETGSFDAAMGEVGEVPLPPYFHGSLPDPERYQTVFAADEGSAAAPTAGLHVTTGVLDGLDAAGVGVAFVDLDVGVDTFRPISADRLEDHEMHSERWRVDDDAAGAIEVTRSAGGRIVAVGTTVVRTLESAAEESGTVSPGEGRTDLFIRPGHRFRCVDVLVTNFHVPGSTLVVLIAAFMGEGWREAYGAALSRGYRFLSFGDAMLAERA